jgi:chlorobactene glucosyltransferase
MIVLPAALTILSGLIALVWTTRHLLLGRESKGGVVLTPNLPGPPNPAPRMSLIVAGKDEEANIESCVRSLLMQDYPNFEVIACNDRSRDRTGEILDRLAAEDQRLRVIHIADLPDGWKGKNHAVHQASRLAEGQYLFFTDADCRQISPRTISVAMQYLQDTGAGLLSILPNLNMRGFWENAVQPACSGVMMIWFRPDKVNNPAKPHAYANGAFMLMRRDAYDRIGGHEAVRDALQEDMTIARKVKQAGLGLTVTRSDGLYDVRMYTSIQQIIAGWTRIFYGSFPTLGRLCLSLLLVLMMGVLPYVTAAVGLSLAAAGTAPVGWWKACGIVGLAAVLIHLSVIARYYHLIRARTSFFWTYSLGALLMVYILLRAMSKHLPGAKVTWKGTIYGK